MTWRAASFLILVLSSGCVIRENDCGYCRKFCYPYEPSVCEQGPFGITCGCDARYHQLSCPSTIAPTPEHEVKKGRK